MMTKIMQLLIGACVVGAIYLFITITAQRADKAAIKVDDAKFDADFAVGMQRFAKTDEAKAHWKEKQRKAEAELEKAEKRQEDAEALEKQQLDGLHSQLQKEAKHADEMEKALEAKERDMLKRQAR